MRKLKLPPIKHGPTDTRGGWGVCSVCLRSWRVGQKTNLPRCTGPRTIRDGVWR